MTVEISALQVKQLRDRTGMPFGDCKAALVATGGDLYALWLVAAAYCAKNDQDPTAYSICQANLDCEVTSMWVDEVPLAASAPAMRRRRPGDVWPISSRSAFVPFAPSRAAA